MKNLFFGIAVGAALALFSAKALSEQPPTGVHAGAWAGAAAAAKASAGASVKTSQTAVQQQQAALLSSQVVNVAPPVAATTGGGGGTTTIRTVPDAYAPTVNATAPCRISVSAGIAVVGIGVSGGGSVEDDPCNLRETARLLDGIGQREAAARVMCNDPRAAEALGATVCPSSAGRSQPGAASATYARRRESEQAALSICDQAALYDDPVLAARNGCR